MTDAILSLLLFFSGQVYLIKIQLNIYRILHRYSLYLETWKLNVTEKLKKMESVIFLCFLLIGCTQPKKQASAPIWNVSSNISKTVNLNSVKLCTIILHAIAINTEISRKIKKLEMSSFLLLFLTCLTNFRSKQAPSADNEGS